MKTPKICLIKYNVTILLNQIMNYVINNQPVTVQLYIQI